MKKGVIAILTAVLLLTGCGNDLGNTRNPAVVNPLAGKETPFTVTIEGDLGGGFWVSGGYLYFSDWLNAEIKAVNLLDTDESITALSMKAEHIWEGDLSNLGYSVGQRNGIGCFYISHEDAETGEYDCLLYRVDGNKQILEAVERGETPFGDSSVIVEDSGDASRTGNLFLLTKDGKRKAVGNAGLHYLHTASWRQNDPSSQVYLLEEEAVLIACEPDGNQYELCKVNLKDGKHTTLWKSDYSLDDVTVDGEYAYVIVPRHEDGAGTMLQKISILDGSAQEVPMKEEESLNSGLFAVLSDTVYYQNGFDSGRPPLIVPPGPNVTEEEMERFNRRNQEDYEAWSRRYIPDQELYRVGDEEYGSLLPGAAVSLLERHGSYIVSQMYKEGESFTTTLIFDESGQVVFETDDGIGDFCIDGNTLVYSLYGQEKFDWSGQTWEVRIVNLK